MRQASPIIVKKIIFWQIGVMILTGLSGLAVFGVSTGGSAAAGSLISWLPNALSARMIFARREANPQRLTSVIFRAELAKFALTAFLFAVVFIGLSGIKPLALFGAYIMTFGVQWLIPLLYKKTTTNLDKNNGK